DGYAGVFKLMSSEQWQPDRFSQPKSLSDARQRLTGVYLSRAPSQSLTGEGQGSMTLFSCLLNHAPGCNLMPCRHDGLAGLDNPRLLRRNGNEAMPKHFCL